MEKLHYFLMYVSNKQLMVSQFVSFPHPCAVSCTDLFWTRLDSLSTSALEVGVWCEKNIARYEFVKHFLEYRANTVRGQWEKISDKTT